MSQFKTFLLPMEPNADAEAEMNGFLKSHRVEHGGADETGGASRPGEPKEGLS